MMVAKSLGHPQRLQSVKSFGRRIGLVRFRKLPGRINPSRAGVLSFILDSGLWTLGGGGTPSWLVGVQRQFAGPPTIFRTGARPIRVGDHTPREYRPGRIAREHGVFFQLGDQDYHFIDLATRHTGDSLRVTRAASDRDEPLGVGLGGDAKHIDPKPAGRVGTGPQAGIGTPIRPEELSPDRRTHGGEIPCGDSFR